MPIMPRWSGAVRCRRRPISNMPGRIRRSAISMSFRSNGGPSSGGGAGDKHVACAFRIDPATGALTPHGAPVALPSRPIHTSVDCVGRISADRLQRSERPDRASHQQRRHAGRPRRRSPIRSTPANSRIRSVATPDNRHVILVTRGNNAPDDNPVNPGSIKVFSFKDGVLDQPRGDPARRRHAVRAAASRFPSDPAMGLCLDREPEQALCLPARCRDRPVARAAVHQGYARRSREASARSAQARSTSIPTAASSI